MALGARIKHYRNKLGWTLQKLADESHVDVGTISALENRDSKSSKFFLSLAQAFGLTLEQLADEAKDWPVDPQPIAGSSSPAAREVATIPYGWPFKTVTPSQWRDLEDEEKALVEQQVLLLAKARAGSKQQPPEKKRAR